MIDRAAATRWKRIAQGGAIGCVALTALLLAWPAAKPNLPPDEMSLPPVELGSAFIPRHTPAADPGITADRFELVSNHPKAPEVVAETHKDEPPAPPPQSDSVAFLGLVRIGSSSLALIRDGDKQKFVRVGDKFGEHSLEEAAEDYIVVGPGRRAINKSPRTGSALTHAQAAPAAPANSGEVVPENPAVRRQRLEAARAAGRAGRGVTPTAPAPGPPGRTMPIVTQGGFQINAPQGLAPEDVQLWRKLRAQLLISGESPENADAAALRQLPGRRAELLEEGAMSREELDAEDTVERQRKEKRAQ